MPVGMEMKYIRCVDETTSGRNNRIRNRRRRRGSDEVAVFSAIHDVGSGRLLAVYRWSSTGVDSGELYTIRQSMLAPDDSSASISVTIVGYEIDEDDVIGRDTPEPEQFTPSDAVSGLSVSARYERLPDGDLQSVRTYTARAEYSV